MSYLAAYGTLRSYWNKPAHSIRLGTIKNYGMYTCGGFPVIFPEESKEIIVEVFEVTPNTLRNLDKYEGINGKKNDLYKRQSLLIDEETTIPYIAEVYVGTEFFRKRKLASIPSGDWLQHIKKLAKTS